MLFRSLNNQKYEPGSAVPLQAGCKLRQKFTVSCPVLQSKSRSAKVLGKTELTASIVARANARASARASAE